MVEKELLDKIFNLELEIKKLKDRKRYGLVWENKIEKFDKESKDALPILRDKGKKYLDVLTDKNKDFNILIEGDNYHSLSVLSYTHKNKIDVIYIDPPYNTGNKDFIYNDHYVDKEDRFRHSKWLSFMSKRLRLTKGLLKKDGMIFISIDDNEQAQLKLLCDEIFGSNNFVGGFIWQKQGNDNKSIFSGTNTLRNDHEFVIIYAREYQSLKFDRPEEDATFQNDYGNVDNDIRGNWMSAELGKSDKHSLPHGKNYFTLKSPTGVEWTRQWHYSENEIKDLIKDNRIYFGQNGDLVPRLKKFLSDKVQKVPSSLLLKQGSTKVGIEEITNIFGGQRPFDYPKPVELIKYILQLHFNKSAIILDFFAGSGTTGQAVLGLNKEDNGNRRFILCTNNENKLCENITYERIKKVSTGYKNLENKKVEGLGGNLKYLKTDFIKLEKSIDSLKNKIVDGSTEILCLKENTFDSIVDSYKKNRIKVFQNSNRYTAILFDLFYFDEFVEQLKKLKDKPVSVYVFSYTKDFSKEEFGNLGIRFTLEPIPEKILETYKKIFNF